MIRNEVDAAQTTRQHRGSVGVSVFALSPASIGPERQAVRRIEEVGYVSILEWRGVGEGSMATRLRDQLLATS
jgi:hypothetical protein